MKFTLGKINVLPKTNQKEAQKKSFPLAHMLRVNQDQDIIQIHNNTETFTPTKEQYWFVENSRGCGHPKWHNLALIRSILPDKIKKRTLEGWQSME